jgi:hypothetical protein
MRASRAASDPADTSVSPSGVRRGRITDRGANCVERIVNANRARAVRRLWQLLLEGDNAHDERRNDEHARLEHRMAGATHGRIVVIMHD